MNNYLVIFNDGNSFRFYGFIECKENVFYFLNIHRKPLMIAPFLSIKYIKTENKEKL